MRPWMTILLMLGLAMSGCLGAEDDSEAPASEGEESTTSPAPASTPTPGNEEPEPTDPEPPQPAPNSPPTPSIQADLDGGPAPLIVNFTLDASDPDGDVLSWELDLDGDGTPDADGVDNLPRVITHTFEGPGNFTVTFTVFDAESHAAATALVQVVAPSGPQGPEPFTFSGSTVLPDPFAMSAEICIMPLADFMGSGAYGQVFSAPAGIDGWSFSMDHADAIATFLAGDTPSGSGNSGTVGTGVDSILACSTSPLVDYTLTISPP